MMRKTITVVLFSLLFVALTNEVGWTKTLFFDDFEGRKDLGKKYVTEYKRAVAGAPKWVVEGGVIKQTEPANMGDSAYAIIVEDDSGKKEFPAVLTIQTKVRIDSWTDGDGARTGVAVRVMLENDGAGEGDGFTFLFHQNKATVQFLNDLKAWGTSAVYNFDVKKWYWMQLHIDDKDMLHAKVWEDGQKEPAKFILEQNTKGDLGNFPRPKGFPALNGGATRGGAITMSFDDVEVWDKDGPSPKAVSSKEKLPLTWGALKSRS